MAQVLENGANLEDALRLAEAFFDASIWAAHGRFDRAAFAEFLENLSASPSGLLIVTPDGFLAGVAYAMPFDPGLVIADEIYWYSEAPGKGGELRAQFEAWAQTMGASVIQMSCQTDEREPALRRLVARAGFEPVSTVFRRVA